MKRYIRSAVNPWKTKYELHWMSPDGKDCLLAGSSDYDAINRSAKKQAKQIFTSPFETDERKKLFLQNMYISEGEEVVDFTDETDEYIGGLMSQL